MAKSAKGGQFERDMARKLSFWWSGGKHDDLFWRASQSGGRATVRGRKGQRTFGQCGDIAATHPDGQSLLDVVTIELKRGYSHSSFAELLDRPNHAATQPFEGFVIQAYSACKLAKTPAWLLITRRDKKECLIFMPKTLADALRLNGSRFQKKGPRAELRVRIRMDEPEVMTIVGTTLDNFLKHTDPSHFHDIATPSH